MKWLEVMTVVIWGFPDLLVAGPEQAVTSRLQR